MVTRLVSMLGLALAPVLAFAQGEGELYQRAQDALDVGKCTLAEQLADSLIATGSVFNLENYYYLRAEARLCLKDYAGERADLDRTLELRDNFCPAMDLRAWLRLRVGDRAGACADWRKANGLCVDHYTRELATHCDEAWEYEKLHQVYRGDSSKVIEVEEAYYIGCSERVSDTTYYLRGDLTEKGDWEIYYDPGLEHICTRLFTRNDTLYSTYFFRSGGKWKENRSVERRWVYSAEWCENRQLVQATPLDMHRPDTATAYHCNGTRKWESLLYLGRAWGTERRWFENGQLRAEVIRTPLDTSLAREGRLQSAVLSERYWDAEGRAIERPRELDIQNINTARAPVRIPREELNGSTPYYNVGPISEYDPMMRKLAARVYELTRLDCESPCKVGQTYLDFLIDKTGAIMNVRVYGSLDPCVDQSFVHALQRLGSWPPGTVQGQAVDVYVRMALELERVKR